MIINYKTECDVYHPDFFQKTNIVKGEDGSLAFEVHDSSKPEGKTLVLKLGIWPNMHTDE
jgi:hypothetical protein